MLCSKSTLALLAVGSLTGFTDAFWRMSCSLIQTGRVDPIISPGKISSHVHKIAGGSNFGISSTYDDLQKSSCTSCEIQADKSAYWTPQLYYEHSSGSFEEVPNSGMTVYYLGRGDNASNITPFPPGFRMVSGDALARSYDTTVLTYKNARPVADRVSFACLDSSSQPETPGLKDTSCSNGLRAQIHFQSCWNGVDLYKTDNSHVAYMSTMDNGVCPPTHPVQLIHLFFEVLYGVNNIKLDNGGRFVFAQGDPTGYGFHGDFLNGWDVGVQQAAITQCGFPGNPSGAIVSCPPLAAVDKQDTSSICPIRPALINEPATGMISKLPGCITITPGPQKATEADMVCASGVSQPSLSARSHAHRLSLRSAAHHHRHHDTTNDNSTINNSTTSDNSTRCITPPIPVVSGMAWAGCFAEGTTGLALTGATYTNPEGMTLDTCVQYCSGKGFGWAGAEDGDLCYCGEGITNGAKLQQTTAACCEPCSGNATELCGGLGHLSVYASG